MYKQALFGSVAGLIGWALLRHLRTDDDAGRSGPGTRSKKTVERREQREATADAQSADPLTLKAAAIAARLRVRKALEEKD